MEYASTLIVTIGLGLLCGQWLTDTYQADPIWTVVLAVLGLFSGISLMAKKLMLSTTVTKPNHPTKKETSAPAQPLDDEPKGPHYPW